MRLSTTLSKLSWTTAGGLLAVLSVQVMPQLGLQAATAHEMQCDKRTGLDRARCDRHVGMFGQCGPLKGDAHFDCDRDYLLANPLDCRSLRGDDLQQCNAELAAAKTCQPQAGRAFMRCVRDTTAADPAGKASAPR